MTGGAEAPSVEGLVDATFAPIHESVHLDVVLDTLTSTPQTWAAVIDDERRVVGTIAVTDIVRNYRVLITAIERGRDVIRPTGETVIKSGDRLMVLGGSEDLDVLGQLASSI